MNLLSGWNWLIAWAALWTGSRKPDPGDMGTAFGLDASLSLDAPAPPPAPKPSTAPTANRVARRPRR